MRRQIGQLMMALGIGILLIPILGSLYTYYEGKKLYEAYLQELQQESLPTEKIESDTIGQGIIPSEDEKPKEIEKVQDREEGDILGRIKIPQIKVDLLLIEGVGKKTLELGAGHMKGTALPGEIGNCALAGHRNYTFGQIFNRLNEVKLGDEIFLEVGEERYTYKVSAVNIINPEDLSILEQPKDKKKVTLITCHPIYRATHRLIVIGELVE
ncbi:MAG: sortase family protein LPXTG-site transpeptidase [Clostridia bacterium]|jgi:sortase A|nr:sortase family protein LPXTG-site transpeptidase [Clostridia bacterium]